MNKLYIHKLGTQEGNQERRQHYEKCIADGTVKTCASCRAEKQVGDFPYKAGGRYGARENCRGCHQANKIKARSNGMKRGAAWTVGPTWGELKRLGYSDEDIQHWGLKRQAGQCAICGISYKDRRMAIDHCHATGKIRGILCINCNNLLGMAGDRVETLMAALAYLQEHSDTPVYNKHLAG